MISFNRRVVKVAVSFLAERNVPIENSAVGLFMNVTKSSNNTRWHRWTNDAQRMFEHLLIASKGSRRIWTEFSKSVWQAARLVCGSKHVEASMCD